MKNKRVKKFNELVDPEMSISLGLPAFLVDQNNKDYFFDYKQINKLWDEDFIKVYVYSVNYDGDSLIFKTKITIYGEEFEIFIIADYDQNVEFGSDKGYDYLENFEEAIYDELEYFKDMIIDIYDEIIPSDFWEVKSRVN